MKRVYLLAMFVCLFTVFAFAADITVPEGDPLAELLKLVTGLKGMAPIAIASSVIVVVVQSLRRFLLDSAAKKAVIVVLGCVYAILQSVMSGLGVMDAMVLVLLTSGGAVAIYEWAVKPFLKKQDEVKPLPEVK